jgi:GNAT superfamily N-acetyltransferase
VRKIRRRYVHASGHSAADLVPIKDDDNTVRWLLQKISTDDGYRRQGLAGELLHAIVKDADIEKVELILYAVGNDRDTEFPSLDTVKRFYSKYGFQVDPEEPEYMSRRSV